MSDQAPTIERLRELMNPTGGEHTPTPWEKRGDAGIIDKATGFAIAGFARTADRDLALYFANAHPGMIGLLRNLAGSFAFISAATDDPGLKTYCDEMAKTTGIYTDIFCRFGQLADGAKDLPMPPEVDDLISAEKKARDKAAAAGMPVVVNAVVHVLDRGEPLCGFTRAVPRDWPEGNLWVDLIHASHATCHRCRLLALH